MRVSVAIRELKCLALIPAELSTNNEDMGDTHVRTYVTQVFISD